MDRSTDDIKDTTKDNGDFKNTAKIYTLHGAQRNAADLQDTGGQGATIIAFDAPGAPAADKTDTLAAETNAAVPSDEALPDNVAVMSRAHLERQTFEKSNDYFDEVPHRVIGVISSREIEEAEDYDIFDEAEQMADVDALVPPEKDETVRGFFKQIFGKIKQFFVHLGYFFTNLKRGIHNKLTAGKRKKAEEERRQRAAERRLQRQDEMERRRADNGLVQVRRRRERRDNDSR